MSSGKNFAVVVQWRVDYKKCMQAADTKFCICKITRVMIVGCRACQTKTNKFFSNLLAMFSLNAKKFVFAKKCLADMRLKFNNAEIDLVVFANYFNLLQFLQSWLQNFQLNG